MKKTLFWMFLTGRLMLLGLVILGAGPVWRRPALASHITASDVERYVRARIDIGESMRAFFRNRRPPQFGPEGGPSMEELRKLEAEINDHIAGILSKYGLTIEQYQSESPDVFAEEAGVERFLSAHPDLKKRYEALPQSPRRGP